MSSNIAKTPKYKSRIPRALIRWLFVYFILHMITAALFFWIISGLVRNQMLRDTNRRMNDLAIQLAEQIARNPKGFADPGLPEYLKSLGDKTAARYTLVDGEGNVIIDSETENRDIGYHGDRPEIIDALQTGSGFSTRFSNTLKKDMMYVATTSGQEKGNVVRVAISADSIGHAIRSVRNYILTLTLSLGALTMLATAWFSSRALAPLTEFASAAQRIGTGDFTSFAPLTRKDEWGDLRTSIRTMQKELKSREEGMTRNSKRLEALLSGMVEGVIATDPSGIVTHANLAACRMMALSREEVIGKSLRDVVRIPELHSAIDDAQSKQTFSKTEFQTITDERRTISGRIAVLDQSESTGVAIVLHDVTDLRQLETVRRDFVANVSHELKTPLAAIKAYAETLRLGAIHDQENNLRFVDQIESQAELLNMQIQDLIQLARVESGKTAFDVTSVSLNDVCHTCYEHFVGIAEQQNVRLRLEQVTGRPVVQADEEGVFTIARNLIANAIQYTPDGGLVIIQTMVERDDALIKVIDNGIGISLEHQSRIFERFYRVDKSRSRELGSTGLGLAIVKHMAQAFGGAIELHSAPGKGSTFTLRLPLLTDSHEATGQVPG